MKAIEYVLFFPGTNVESTEPVRVFYVVFPVIAAGLIILSTLLIVSHKKEIHLFLFCIGGFRKLVLAFRQTFGNSRMSVFRFLPFIGSSRKSVSVFPHLFGSFRKLVFKIFLFIGSLRKFEFILQETFGGSRRSKRDKYD